MRRALPDRPEERRDEATRRAATPGNRAASNGRSDRVASLQRTLGNQVVQRATETRSGSGTAGDRSTYTVRPGDSLSKIARRFDVPGGWPALHAANRDVLGDDPDTIYPGQELTLPDSAGAAGSDSAEREAGSAGGTSSSGGSSWDAGEAEAEPGFELNTWANLFYRGVTTNTMRGGTQVGTVYFSTDDSTLDSRDRQALESLRTDLMGELTGGERRYDLEFVGYADERASERYNLALSADRARAVEAYFSELSELMYGSENYSSETTPMGEFTAEQTGETAEELAPYRRVDIVVRPPVTPEPIERESDEPERPEGPPESREWKVRLRGAAAGGVLAGVALVGVEIIDRTNGLRMYYEFKGGGVSVGLSGAHPGTDWYTFDTYEPLNIEEWEGAAAYASGGIQLSAGPSVDKMTLTGPSDVDPVQAQWAGWSEGWGLGGGLNWGTLSPLTEPEEVESGPPDLQIE